MDYVVGVARNDRLVQAIDRELQQAKRACHKSGEAARVFKDFTYRTRETWSRERRVVGKAGYLPKGANPRRAFPLTHRPDRRPRGPHRARAGGRDRLHPQPNGRLVMLTLLGSLLGFATSAIPDIMSMFRERADRAHEFAVLDRQMEQKRLGYTQRLEEIEVQADIAESKALYRHDAALGGSSRWVDSLRASVRPLITYAFFILFASVKGSGLYLLIVVEGLPRIWDPETQALFAAVMSFWFGNRTLSKLRERR